MRQRLVPVLLIAVAACAAGAPPRTASAPGTSTAPYAVDIHDFVFTPRTLAVPLGAIVTWVNRDIAPHTTTRNRSDERWDSGDMRVNATYSHTFQVLGSYDYLCFYHPGMTGRIVVQ